MKKYFIYFILLGIFYSIPVSAVEPTTSGFITNSIWYSKSPLVEGDKVKIYTAIWNNDKSPLTAKVDFYDKDTLLGSRDIIVLSLQLKDVSIYWKVTSGDHSISARISSPKLSSGGKKKSIVIDRNKTDIDSIFIPIVIRNADGKAITNEGIILDQIEKVTSSFGDIIPTNISEPIVENINIIDIFRAETLDSINETKKKTKNKINELNKINKQKELNDATINISENKDKFVVNKPKVAIENATEKPITYLKLFFLTISSFIFSSKISFYLLIFFLIILFLRFLYRRFR